MYLEYTTTEIVLFCCSSWVSSSRIFSSIFTNAAAGSAGRLAKSRSAIIFLFSATSAAAPGPRPRPNPNRHGDCGKGRDNSDRHFAVAEPQHCAKNTDTNARDQP